MGDIARPDLAVDKEEGARGIFHSLHEQLLTLPDTCEIWPGHLGGSLCGGPGMDMKGSSTIGYERGHSELLAIGAEDEFVQRTTARAAPAAAELRGDRRAQPRAARDRDAPTRIRSLRARSSRRSAMGRWWWTCAPSCSSTRRTSRGAVSITALRAGFGSKLAWLVEAEQRVVLVGRDDEDAHHAADLAASVAITRIAGFLAGGMTSWREERLPVERIERITVPELRERADELQILDVREQSEWDAGHIPGSIHTPYHDVHAIRTGSTPSGRSR